MTFTPSDLRKFAEQYGDIIRWDQTNRAYILTHGVSGIDWAHYKHPLPEYRLRELHAVLGIGAPIGEGNTARNIENT